MLVLGVVGASSCSPEVESLAYSLGSEIAERGAALVCGGHGGVMQAACRGARAHGGLTIAILPGDDPSSANPFVDIPVATGMGEARNVILVRSSACLVAVGGEYGTLSEIAFALKLGIPVVGLESWHLTLPGSGHEAPIHVARDPREAVDMAMELAAAARAGSRNSAARKAPGRPE